MVTFHEYFTYLKFQALLGDLVLMWRVWIVWDKQYWAIAIPFVATIAAWGKRPLCPLHNYKLTHHGFDRKV